MANPVSDYSIPFHSHDSYHRAYLKDVSPTQPSIQSLFANITTLDSSMVCRYQEEAQRRGETLTFGQAAARCLRETWQDPPGSSVFQRVDLTGDFFCQELIEAFQKYGSGISHLKLSTFNIPYWKGGALEGMFANMCALESLSIEKSNFNEALDLDSLPRLKSLRLIDCSFLQRPPRIPPENVLETLEMLRCEALAFPPDLTHAKCLKKIRLAVCDALVDAPAIPKGSLLEELDLWGCGALCHMPPIPRAPHLKVINLSGCTRLTAEPLFQEWSEARIVR